MIRLVSSSKGKPPEPPTRSPRPLSERAAIIEAIIRPAPLPRRVVQKIKAHMAEAKLRQIPKWHKVKIGDDE